MTSCTPVQAMDIVKWSLLRIKKHLDTGYPDRALRRTEITITAIEKYQGKHIPKHHSPVKVVV